jgi:hypothetical protein
VTNEALQLWLVFFTLQCVAAFKWLGYQGLIGSLVGTFAYLFFF